MTAAQAVECLGRAVHVGVARRLVLRLAAEGVLSTGLTYGSAFSGIDTFAAGVDQVFGEDWRYAFASEASAVARRGLCAAWGSRALTEGMVWQDARGEAASAVSYVDLYVTTPNCETYSRRNHGPSAKMQHTSLRDVWRSGDRGERGGANGGGAAYGATGPAGGVHAADEHAGPSSSRGSTGGPREAVLGASAPLVLGPRRHAHVGMGGRGPGRQRGGPRAHRWDT